MTIVSLPEARQDPTVERVDESKRRRGPQAERAATDLRSACADVDFRGRAARP